MIRIVPLDIIKSIYIPLHITVLIPKREERGLKDQNLEKDLIDRIEGGSRYRWSKLPTSNIVGANPIHPSGGNTRHRCLCPVKSQEVNEGS